MMVLTPVGKGKGGKLSTRRVPALLMSEMRCAGQHPELGQLPGAAASLPFALPGSLFVLGGTCAQKVSLSVFRTTAMSPANELLPMLTLGPLQRALMTVSLMRTMTHGSAGVCVPLYFQPFEPAGSPSPVHVPPLRAN